MQNQTLKSHPTHTEELSGFLHGSGIIIIGMGAKILFTFATEVMAARILMPERYGLITWGLFLCNILCMMTGLGLNTALRRFLAIYRSRNDLSSIKGLIDLSGYTGISTGIAGAVVLFFASAWLSNSVFGDERELHVLQTLVLSIPSWTLLKIMLAVFGGLERPLYKVIIEDFFIPLGFFGVILAAWIIDFKEAGIALGFTIIYFIAAILSVYCVRTKTLYSETHSLAPTYHTRSIFKFSWPLVFTEPLGKCTGMIDILIVGALAATYQVGIFRVASDMAATMAITLLCMGFMYLPIASRFIDTGEHERWNDMNARVARWSMLIIFPVFATLFFFPHEILNIIYGSQYTEGASALRILALAYFGYSMVGVTGLNLILKEMTSTQLIGNLFTLGMNISANFILIPIYGLKGAAFATLLSLWTLNIFYLILMRVRMKLQPFTLLYIKSLVMLLVIAFLSFFVIHHINISNGIISVALFLTGIFSGGFVLFRLGFLFDSTDIDLVRNILVKRV